jgi:RHS repeat-associated protein
VHTDTNRVVALGLLDTNDGETALLRFTYNDFGDLTEVVNSSGLPQRFDYDIEGRMTRWADRNNTTYSYSYDEQGRCAATEGSGGYLSGQLSYAPGLTTVVDSLGHETVYRINAHVQIESVTDPLGNTTSYTWDRYDRKLSEIDPLGRTTRYTYSDAGDLIEVVRADGSRATADYNDLHQPTRQTGFDGATWHRRYDERGNQVTVTDPLGASTTYLWHERGLTSGWVGPVGETVRVECDAAGLPLAVTDPVGGVVRYERDDAGRVVALSDPASGVTRFRYTPDGKLGARTLPDGATETWDHDAEGNVIAHTDPAGQVTRFEISHFDLQIARVDPDGNQISFRYDTELRLVAVTNAQGLTWRYNYDAAGRLRTETDFNGRTLSYIHDAAGQLVGRRNASGQMNEFVRDLVGNLVEKRTPEGVARFTYDAAGRLLRAVSPDADLVFSRDPLGRVVAETCNGLTITSTFDTGGRRIRRVTPSGAESRWEYDLRSQPTVLHVGEQTMRFAYDIVGRETRRTLDSGLNMTQSWDPNGRPLTHTVTADGQRPVTQRTHRYAADGLLSAVDDTRCGSHEIDVDPCGRVVAVNGSQWTERYAYDAAGNVTRAAWPAIVGENDCAGERQYDGTLIRRAGDTRYEYDRDGRVTLRQQKQRSTKPWTWRYFWDSEDRLTSVITPDGIQWRYRYDPLGRRIAKQRLDADGTVAEHIAFVWDGPLLAEQSAGNFSTVWEWRPGQLCPLTQADRHTDQAQIDERFYALVTDLVGAPTELVTPDGDLAWETRRNIWGAISASGSAECPLRFPGQYHDKETGLSYNYFRYYDPVTARYQCGDPLGLVGSPNPHAYVSNPTESVDPLGLAPYRANYTSQSAHHVFTHGHAANAPRIPGKSRFRMTEGGQKFTDEVLSHPNLGPPVYQGNGRILYEVPDLGRGPVGWDRFGNPAVGGRVIVEGSAPAAWSTFSPGEVVTQFPI